MTCTECVDVTWTRSKDVTDWPKVNSQRGSSSAQCKKYKITKADREKWEKQLEKYIEKTYIDEKGTCCKPCICRRDLRKGKPSSKNIVEVFPMDFTRGQQKCPYSVSKKFKMKKTTTTYYCAPPKPKPQKEKTIPRPKTGRRQRRRR